MNYVTFRSIVQKAGYTIRQLRCDDAPPCEELLDLMGTVGLDRFEKYVERLERELAQQPKLNNQH